MASINPERAILLGMCADLADSCMQLTRYFDDEPLDIARINEEVSLFCGRMEAWRWLANALVGVSVSTDGACLWRSVAVMSFGFSS